MLPIDSSRLTSGQRDALELLKRCYGHDAGWGVVTSSQSCALDGQAWVHWRTAFALERRGLVEIDRTWPDNFQLILTKEGFDVAPR